MPFRSHWDSFRSETIESWSDSVQIVPYRRDDADHKICENCARGRAGGQNGAGYDFPFRLRAPLLSLFCYGWALHWMAVNLFSPPVMHRYYLTAVGFALLFGIGLSLCMTKAY